MWATYVLRVWATCVLRVGDVRAACVLLRVCVLRACCVTYCCVRACVAAGQVAFPPLTCRSWKMDKIPNVWVASTDAVQSPRQPPKAEVIKQKSDGSQTRHTYYCCAHTRRCALRACVRACE